jgi:uncharacterized protein (TIGR03067 family)
MSRMALLPLLCLAVPAAAQPDPFVRPLPPAAAGTEGLGRLLRDLGFAPKALSPDVFQVTVDRDRWPVHVMLSLSTDGRRIWLESKFAPVEDPDKVPPQAWRRLLEANEKIGPAHFAFDKNDRRIHLYKSFDNQALSAARLKAEIEHFDTTVRKTQDYWRGDNFKPVVASSDPPPAAQKTVLPAPEGPAFPPLPPPPLPAAGPVVIVDAGDGERLMGDWQVVEIRVHGRPAEVSSDRKPSVTFRQARNGDPGRGGKNAVVADLRTGPAGTRTVGASLASAPPNRGIDLTDQDGVSEQGIYKFEGDTLTLCFAAPGEPRPTSFDHATGGGGWTLVLKKR